MSTRPIGEPFPHLPLLFLYRTRGGDCESFQRRSHPPATATRTKAAAIPSLLFLNLLSASDARARAA
jgi:hypothetical protein